MNNCWIWCIHKRITKGGSIKIYKSRRWIGYHTTWIDNDGIEWEYTLPNIKNKPWWYIPILYHGVVRKKRNGFGV